MPKMYDFYCKECGKEDKDIIVDSHESTHNCSECDKPMEKDYSGFKGMHTDSNFRPSAVRRKGKYKIPKKERKRKKFRKKVKEVYNIRGE